MILSYRIILKERFALLFSNLKNMKARPANAKYGTINKNS